MKIATAISCGVNARYAKFFHSLMNVKGVSPGSTLMCRGANIAENRIKVTEQAISLGFDAIWYVDDDQVFGPDTLQQLASHDKDIVSGLYLDRQMPFAPQVYVKSAEPGLYHQRFLRPLDHGLVKADVVGAGCLLVKLHVYDKLQKPWWRLGQIAPEAWGEDTDWCLRMKELGFQVWADLACPVGHEMTGTIWPLYNKDTGEWTTALVPDTQPIAFWPAAGSMEMGK